jgi:hypothetical protein
LLLTYLGVPLHNKNLTKEHWNFLLAKIENKLTGWQGKLLSIGGRVTLLNYVSSAILIYWMSMYRLPKNVRNVIDKLRK